ncbi:tetratricopeptide repeat protein [Streptomyces sp. NPDC088794]|uniref:tetratricopeptide repeat protein n=1 Tax=Streptomyces sp. NPDC088794 TaxID=3365902 RepID=UPI003806384B
MRMAVGWQRLDAGVVEVAARLPGRARLVLGSGRLLPDGYVLTAGHVVPEPGTGETWVRSVSGGDDREWLKCRVVHRRYMPREKAAPGREAVDLAVLHCADPRLAELPGLPPYRWGRLVTDPCRARVSATGFPSGSAVLRLDAIPAFRDTAQIDGVISTPVPGLGWREVRVHGPVPALFGAGSGGGSDGERASRWKGMSGSGVLCNDLLVGVVVSARPEPDSGRLYVQDLAPLWDDPGLRALLRLPPEGPHTAELQPLLHPHTGHAMNSPISLLRPEAGVVEFHGRRCELRRIADWRDGDRPAAVRLITGPGGQGKTRLALKTVEKARRAGWAAAFLAERADPDELRAFLSSRTVPLLLVLDYAEARTGQVRSLCEMLRDETAHDEPGRPPVRILLLARKAGEWWTTTAQYARTLGLLEDGSDTFALPVLDPSPEERGKAARLAAHGLVAGLRRQRPGTDPLDAPLPDVTDERFAAALNLQMAVLVAQLQHLDPVPVTGGEPDEMILLRHECKHWQRTLAQFGLDDLPERELPLMVAAATLCGADDMTEAVNTLCRLPREEDGASADPAAAARWLAGLYPSDGRYWGALQPDRLGEFLVGSVLAEERRLLDWLLPTASRRQVESAFHVLSRAVPHQAPVAERLREVVIRHPAQLAPAAVRTATEVAEPAPLREALDAVLEELERRSGGDTALAGELYEAVPFPTLALDQWAADLAGLLTRRARETPTGENATGQTAALAGRLHRYAMRLGEVDRAEAALTAIEEAIGLRRKLAADGDPGAQESLALSLNTRTGLLADDGRTLEALASAREVIECYRRLSEADPERHLPDLAMAETNLANQLTDTGARPEAVEPARTALERYRSLAAHDPVYAPDVALACHNLAHALASAGRRSEAVAAATDAVAAYRNLARQTPDSHLPDLADALANLANQLLEAGGYDEAEAAMDEALDIYRKIADRSPARQIPNLAATLSNAVVIFRACGNGARAVATAEEAVTLLRPQARRQPLARQSVLGSALNNLGIQYSEEEQPEDAVTAAEEAVRLFREGFRTLPDAYRPLLANALCNLGNYLGDLGDTERIPEGLRNVRASIALLRELTAAEPEAHAPRLAVAVDVLGNSLHDLGKTEEALPHYEEAYELLVPFAETEHRSHLEQLADVGANWSAALVVLERWRDLLALTERTIGLLRAARQDPVPHRGSLSKALSTRGIALAELGRPHDAVGLFHEAVLLSRQLTEEQPDHLEVLLHDLEHLAQALHNVGRRSEVAAVTAEAVAAYRQPAAAAFRPEHRAASLVAHAEALVLAGDHRGLEAAEEAVQVCRELAAADSVEAEALLCPALDWYASALFREGMREAAIEAGEEALRHNRELSLDVASAALSLAWALVEGESAPRAIELAEEALTLLDFEEADDWQGEVALAHEVIAKAQLALDRAERALESALRSVDLHRPLADAVPEVYASALAQALGSYALALHATGRHPEAVTAAEEAVTVTRGRFTAEPMAYAFDLASVLIVRGRVGGGSPALGEAARIAERYGWRRLAEEARQG